MISRVVSLIGTASPRPTPATAGCPDDPTMVIGENTTAIARIEGSIRLDDLIDNPTSSGGKRPTEGRNDSRSDTASQTERIAKSDNKLPNPQACSIAKLDRSRHLRARMKYSKIGERVTSNDVDGHLGAIREQGLSSVRTANHVCAGQKVAIQGDDTRASGAAANRRANADAGNCRKNALRDVNYRAGIRIEGFGLAHDSKREPFWCPMGSVRCGQIVHRTVESCKGVAPVCGGRWRFRTRFGSTKELPRIPVMGPRLGGPSL